MYDVRVHPVEACLPRCMRREFDICRCRATDMTCMVRERLNRNVCSMLRVCSTIKWFASHGRTLYFIPLAACDVRVPERQIRVYQDKNNSRMTVGCDTPSHPSKQWIEAHKYRYMRTVSIRSKRTSYRLTVHRPLFLTCLRSFYCLVPHSGVCSFGHPKKYIYIYIIYLSVRFDVCSISISERPACTCSAIGPSAVVGYFLGCRIAHSCWRAPPQLPDKGSLPQGDALTRLLDMCLPCLCSVCACVCRVVSISVFGHCTRGTRVEYA